MTLTMVGVTTGFKATKPRPWLPRGWRGPGRAAVALAVLVVVACRPSGTPDTIGPIDVGAEPRQEAVAVPEAMRFARDGVEWTMTPLARYVLAGVVVGRENYHFGWNATLSPCDLAMVWGELARSDLFERLRWSQSGRWYFWSPRRGFAHDNAFVARHSSNTHIIPANRNVERAVRLLGPGDMAELTGELVRIEGHKDGRTMVWTSSLSREDSGDGSCELLYLRRVRYDGTIYQ
jgi:hypothetical protein